MPSRNGAAKEKSPEGSRGPVVDRERPDRMNPTRASHQNSSPSHASVLSGRYKPWKLPWATILAPFGLRPQPCRFAYVARRTARAVSGRIRLRAVCFAIPQMPCCPCQVVYAQLCMFRGRAHGGGGRHGERSDMLSRDICTIYLPTRAK